MVKLDEVVSLKSGKLNTNRGVNYNIPYYCSNGVIGYVETPTFDGEYTITALDLSIGAVHYMNGKFATSQHAINLTSLDIKKLNNKYMYYWLKLNNTLLKNMSKGIKPGILRSDIANLQMPLPPIETQKEIVATLDRIYAPGTTELAETFKLTDKAMDLVLAGATAQGGASLEPIVEAQRLMRKSAQMVADVKAQMVADVKAQMVALMRSVNMRGFETIRLGDIIDMSKGKLQATKCDGGQYPVISISNKWTHSTNSDEGEHVYIASTSSGASSGPFETVIKYHNGKCSSTSLMQRLDIKNTNKISYKYLYYGLNHIKEMIQNMCEKGSCNKTMNVERFLDLQIIVPPVDVQQDIIRRIEVIQSQLSSLENLGKQAEDNARFILNSYLNTA
jgi:type I restriction enzyme S subunit